MKGLIGSLVDGRWRILRKIGQGGMATVYLAKQVSLDREVAVKVLQADHAMAEELRRRFQREIRAMSSLSHAHVVPLLDVGETDGVPYLVLRYMEGGSLRTRFSEAGGRLSCHRVQKWLRPLAAALDFFHAREVVHRDVKPDNILFDAAGEAFLSDFGIARALGPEVSALTRAGQLVGTLSYLAPECLEDRPASGSRDQYALGVTVYEALTGRLPFLATSYSSLVARILTESPPSLQDLVPDIPGKCAEAVLRAVSRDPAQRHGSCTAFAEMFAEGVAGPGVGTPARQRTTRSFSYDPGTLAALAKFLREGKEGFRRDHKSNEQGLLTVTHDLTGLKFVLVPGGEFTMGSGDDEEGRYEDESPAHSVRVRPFLLCVTTCTQEAWERGDGAGRGRDGDLRLPVRGVLWAQAREWCGRNGLRLPTEAEWECACRASAPTRFCSGEAERVLEEHAWYVGNSGNQAHPVGELKPNAWGLFDMHGNVWEWCEDTYFPSYEGAPADGRAWLADDSPMRVVRGGAWSSPARDCRSAARNRWPPGIASDVTGFRPAASLPGVE